MSEIEKCIEVLKAGGVIIYPTDTVWGLGCDATNEAAVEKLSSIKKRSKEGYIVLVSDDRMLMNHVTAIPDIAWELIDSGERPLTLILDKGRGLTEKVMGPDQSVAVRMIKSGFAYELIRRFRKPITSTSANFSGSPSPASFSEISAELIRQVDYAAPKEEDNSVFSKPSSIIKLSQSGEIEIIRR